MVQKNFKRRVYVTSAFILIIAGLYVYRLFSLHFSNKIRLNDPNRIIHIRRGYIADRNNDILALSIEKTSIYANPREIKNISTASEKIASIFGEGKDRYYKKLNNNKMFVWIKRKLEDDTAESFKKLKISGIYLKKEFKRVYPNGELAANILGFTGIENNGLEGMEFQFDSILNGSPKNEGDNFTLGNNVILTIDKYIQYYCEKYLKETIEKYSASQGAVIVMDPSNGEVLAYAKYPGYNPNFYYKHNRSEWKNYAIVDTFEPGSTMKIFSVASLINSGKYSKDKMYYCKGAAQIANTVINCTGVHGEVDATEMIKHSCNVGVITSMNDVSSNTLYATLRKFGFGEKTGSKFPGESSGILREVDRWSGLSKFSISIGQEISVTVLQLAAAYSSIANNGLYIEPKIIKRVEDYTGEVVTIFNSKIRGRVISKETALLLKKMLGEVVDGGTGRLAMSAYYKFGGKTGTAQKYIKSTGLYSSSSNVASFVGIAPLENPKLVIAVIIDEPQLVTSGGQVAAPLFKKIAEKSLIYLGESRRVLKKIDPLDRRVKLTDINHEVMPDFRGMDFVDAACILREIQKSKAIKYYIDGEGVVSKQSPYPGSKIRNGQNIRLFTSNENE